MQQRLPNNNKLMNKWQYGALLVCFTAKTQAPGVHTGAPRFTAGLLQSHHTWGILSALKSASPITLKQLGASGELKSRHNQEVLTLFWNFKALSSCEYNLVWSCSQKPSCWSILSDELYAFNADHCWERASGHVLNYESLAQTLWVTLFLS